MAIEKISRVNNITAPTSMPNVTNAGKNLQSQLLIKQQNLKKLSTNADLSAKEKEKQRKELQKEIEELKRKLEQMRLKQEETEKAKDVKEQKEIEKATELNETSEKKEKEDDISFEAEMEKYQEKNISMDEVQKMLVHNLFLKDEMVQQGVDYDKQNTMRVLSSEIKQNEIHGMDTDSKKIQLKELLEKELFQLEGNSDKSEKPNKKEAAIHPDTQVVIDNQQLHQTFSII